ncbi:MAG: DUF1653 domain-containing protein [Candidatus Paceibacterota bacterium]|jgi:hypothetical protein
MENEDEIELGLYEHYKGGLYEVVGVVNHSETLEKMVLYKHLDNGELWVRPLLMFKEFVEKDGVKIPRFKKVEN